jgi:hypothetical protein
MALVAFIPMDEAELNAMTTLLRQIIANRGASAAMLKIYRSVLEKIDHAPLELEE